MTDDLSSRKPEDPNRIDLSKPEDIDYWTRELGITEQQLRAAVAEVGNWVSDVRSHLNIPKKRHGFRM